MNKKIMILVTNLLTISCLGYSEDIVVYEYDQENKCRSEKPYIIGKTDSDGDTTTIGFCFVSDDKKYITTTTKEGWPSTLDDSFSPCNNEEIMHNKTSCTTINNTNKQPYINM